MLIKLTQIILKFYTSYNEMTNGTHCCPPPPPLLFLNHVHLSPFMDFSILYICSPTGIMLSWFFNSMSWNQEVWVSQLCSLPLHKYFKITLPFYKRKNKAARIIAKIYNLQINLGRSDIITILHFLTHECLMPLHLLHSSIISLYHVW